MKIAALRTEADIATIGNDRLRRIHAYWQAKRGARAMPTRGDIDMDDLVDLAPNLLLVSVEGEPPAFRYQRFGHGVVSLFGENPEGHELAEYDGKGVEIVRAGYLAVLEQKCAIRQANFGSFGMDPSATVLRYERVLLPLADDGMTVNAILVLSIQAPL